MKNEKEIEKGKFNDKDKFINNIKSKQNNLWLPDINEKLYDIKNNTWFNIKESNKHKNKFKLKNDSNIKYDNIDEKVNIVKTKKILLRLNLNQKNIINNWFYAYIKMYNKTLEYIKNQYKNNTKFTVNFINIRKSLLEDKRLILEKSNIKVHDIDYAIKLACTNYKSAITNKKNKHIKNFKINYWKYNKKIKFIDLEKNNFCNNTIRQKILGEVKGYYNGEEYNFNEIKHDCKLIYNGFIKEYILYIPEEVKCKDEKKEKNKIISLDPGIRTMFTGISENKIIKIGENIYEKINKYLERIDKINQNKKIPNIKKLKCEYKLNKKIKNYVDEIHWKTINYLTKNYLTIFIGNMSCKKIVNNLNKTNLNKKVKRVCHKLKFYEFHERLKYKCYVNNINYKLVNESFTSKICSNCGNESKHLGSNKIYNCVNCKVTLDRDINGARNIYLKGYI